MNFFISNCDRFFGFANAQEGIKFDVSEFEFTNFGRDYKLPIGISFD